MDKVDKLLAIEEIKNLKARYFRLMDAKLWDELSDVFTMDAILDVRASRAVKPAEVDTTDAAAAEEAGYLVGHTVIMNTMRTVGGAMISVHHGHMPEIQIESDDEATAIWAMEDLVEWPKEDRYAGSVHGYGWYHDTYVRVTGAWRIKRSVIVRIRVEYT
jgi:hypothetical protein